MAVVLVDAQGYPLDEVSRLLGVPLGTVKSRCSRGRARLAVLLRESQSRDNGNPGSITAVLPQEPTTDDGPQPPPGGEQS